MEREQTIKKAKEIVGGILNDFEFLCKNLEGVKRGIEMGEARLKQLNKFYGELEVVKGLLFNTNKEIELKKAELGIAQNGLEKTLNDIRDAEIKLTATLSAGDNIISDARKSASVYYEEVEKDRRFLMSLKEWIEVKEPELIQKEKDLQIVEKRFRKLYADKDATFLI